MKKTLTMGVIILLAIGASLIVYASNVANSKHNMQTHMTGQANTEICVFCHTPHGASPAIPLWNHDPSQASSFAVYNTSATLDGSVGQPADISLACLGCHDGTTAIDAIGNTPSNWSTTGVTYPSANIDAGGKLIGGFALLGTDLSNDHPISITYRDDLDTDLQTNTGATVVQYGNTLQLYGAADPYTVECASCHNVHDNTLQPFLRISNAGSMLCRTCHNK